MSTAPHQTTLSLTLALLGPLLEMTLLSLKGGAPLGATAKPGNEPLPGLQWDLVAMSPDSRQAARLGSLTLQGIETAPRPGQGLSHLWPSEDVVFRDLVAEGQSCPRGSS